MTPDPAGPLVLALDTASATGGVALMRGAVVLGEEAWQAGGRQTAEVLPAAVRLWQRAGVSPASLDLVAVSAGPGSYTGLRVGFSLAKGLALASGVPLLAVPTLEAIAYQHQAEAQTIWAVMDAGRGQAYVARYRPAAPGAGVVEAAAPAVLTPDELRALLGAAAPALVCGELYPRLIDALRPGAAPGVRFASPAAALRRPAFLAQIARQRMAAGETADAAALQPLYLRRTP